MFENSKNKKMVMTLAAYRRKVDCCETSITIFAFLSWCSIMPLNGVINYVFTARYTLVQSAVLRSHVVGPSVRLSVTLVDCDHICRSSSKIISRLVSLGCSLFATPTRQVYSKGPPWAGTSNKGRVGKIISFFFKREYLENGNRFG